MRRFLIVSVVVVAGFLPSLYAQAPLPSAASFDVGFSPGGTALIVVEKAIGAAKSEILMACYEFTSRDIAAALEAAAHRGVKVRIVGSSVPQAHPARWTLDPTSWTASPDAKRQRGHAKGNDALHGSTHAA